MRDPQNSNNWGRLFSFAPACFARPGRGGKSRNLTSLRLRLSTRALQTRYPLSSVRKQAGTRKGVAGAGSKEGISETGKGRREGRHPAAEPSGNSGSNYTSHPDQPASLTPTSALHPPVDRRLVPTTSIAPLHATPQAVLEAITTFKHGSAGGPDGLRPQHLKDLLDGVRGNVGSENVDGGTSGSGSRPIANSLLEAITHLVNLLLAGRCRSSSVLASTREDLETLASRLPFMPAHDCLFLLRNVTTPCLVYTLRAAPCTGSRELGLYDEVLRSTLSATLNVDLSDEGWQQASLSVRWRGLGVHRAVMLAPSVYLASAASTATLVLKLLPSFLHHISDRSTPNALAAWQSAVEPSTLSPVDVAETRQRSWDDPQHASDSRHCY